MNKYYFGPIWEYIYYLLALPILIFFTAIMISAYDASMIALVGLVAVILIFLLWLFVALKRFSYYLVLCGTDLIEKGIAVSNRKVNVGSIRSIERAKFEYFFGTGFYNFASSTRHFYIKATPEISPEVFPYYSISSRKIIRDILKLNPSITISNELADLLPSDVRKNLGIDLKLIDRVGLVLGRLLVGILLVLLTFIAVAVSGSFMSFY